MSLSVLVCLAALTLGAAGAGAVTQSREKPPRRGRGIVAIWLATSRIFPSR